MCHQRTASVYCTVPISRIHCIRIPGKGYLKINLSILVLLFVALSRQRMTGTVRCRDGFFVVKLYWHAVSGVLFTAAADVFVFESLSEHRPDVGAT